MVRPTDQKRVVIEKMVCYSSPEGGAPSPRSTMVGGMQGSTRVSHRQKEGGCAQETFLWFLQEQSEYGRMNRVRLPGLNDFRSPRV